MTLSEELRWRGFVNQTTLANITDLDSQHSTMYFGVDPSANSMTVGNLAAALMVRHFIDHGYSAVLLVGGATGIIGDPDGKSEERQLKTLGEIAKNKAAIAAQYKQIFNGKKFDLVDNYEWFKDIKFIDFLRDIGKQFSMTQLLDRKFVQSRIGKGGKGISYAEFSYLLLQAYDFLHLYRTRGVTLQLCGADQWSNSIAGVDLIRKLEGKTAHVWSAPLVINKATGKKFGKTEAGAVWLDPKKTSVFDFYQFWLNVDDDVALDYLKIFTLLSKEKIDAIAKAFAANRAERAAQKALAYEVTALVHGKTEADAAKQATAALFNGGDAELLPEVHLTAGDYDVAELIVKLHLAASKSAATRLLAQGGVKLNRKKITTPRVTVKGGDVVQVGKRHFAKIAA